MWKRVSVTFSIARGGAAGPERLRGSVGAVDLQSRRSLSLTAEPLATDRSPVPDERSSGDAGGHRRLLSSRGRRMCAASFPRGGRFGLDGDRRNRNAGPGEASLCAGARNGRRGAALHRLFQRAFRVAKQVRTHTDITRGAVSVGSVAVELAVKIFGELSERKVLVVGAGETSERTARALISRGVNDIRVTNRSAERAEALAAQVGGRAVPFGDGKTNAARSIF